MKVAIVGTGNIANTHAQALGLLRQDVVLAVNHRAEAAAAFAVRWGIPRSSTQLQEALAPEIDCIHLCTPPALHYADALRILQAGKHLICEKPLCLSAYQARELMELAKAQGVLAAVNFNVRYHDACQKAKQYIDEGQLGPVQLVHGSYLQEFHLLPAEDSWRYRPALAGAMRAITEIGSHWVDLVRFWTGLEVEAVSALLGRFAPRRDLKDGVMYPPGTSGGQVVEVDSEDAACILLRLSSGAIGSVVLSEVAAGRSNALSLEVAGPRGSLWWCSEEPEKLNTAQKHGGVTTHTNAFAGGFAGSFQAFFAQVYAALEDGSYTASPTWPSFYDGYMNAAVCEAIWQSDQNHAAWIPVLP